MLPHPMSAAASSPHSHPALRRRDFLWNAGGGLAGLACSRLLALDSLATPPPPEFNGGIHHPARVKRVIQLFMTAPQSPVWPSGLTLGPSIWPWCFSSAGL